MPFPLPLGTMREEAVVCPGPRECRICKVQQISQQPKWQARPRGQIAWVALGGSSSQGGGSRRPRPAMASPGELTLEVLPFAPMLGSLMELSRV